MRRIQALLAVLALLLVGGADAAQAKSHGKRTTIPRDWIGVMADGPMTAPGSQFGSEWGRIRSSGATFTRVAFYWPQLQPGSGDATDFTTTDAAVQNAARHGLAVLPVVVGTPEWAAEHPGRLGSPPKDPADYAALLTQLVARYGVDGSFWTEHPELRPQPIRAWQIWNEPSLPSYWSDNAHWARGYVALLRAAHAALRKADPRATVVLAGLPNYSWRDLAKVYRAGGRKAFDVAAVHAYTGSPSGVVTIVSRNRRVMRHNHDRRKPIWLTELAWPSSKGKRKATQGWEVTERTQAKRIKRAIPLLARERKRLGIGRVVWFTWLSQEDHKTWQSYTGLRRLRHHKVVALPAYSAFRRVVRALRRR